VLAEALFLAALQVGPFFETSGTSSALRPFWSREGETTDVLWPLYTKHRDWWRCLFFVHGQTRDEGGGQFSVMPLWFNGSDKNGEKYFGLFPLYGRHPHLLFMYDLEFALWPLWTGYSMPRPEEGRMMRSHAVCFPLVSWRDDGSWGVWPIYGKSRNRANVHQYALWPFFNWAEHEGDRDTAGAGDTWMFWPIYGYSARERERQALFVPPFFSIAQTDSALRLRWPWPFVEYESGKARKRLSVFPLYEQIDDYSYADGSVIGSTVRFGWKLVELMPSEKRVFPFWARNDDGYLRVWPFYERIPAGDGVLHRRVLSLLPIRHAPAVDRNWAKFWTFYEADETPVDVRHSLFWGLVNWRTCR
jgi:hypothetical protein